MPVEYTKLDKSIVQGIKITILDDPKFMPDPGALIELTDGFTFDVSGGMSFSGGGLSFPFQFPPRVKSDSKSASWWENNNLRSWEPIVIWTGATAREITIEFVYIVDGRNPDEGEWTPERIARITNASRAYFYRTFGTSSDGSTDFGPVVVIKNLYNNVRPGVKSTWRMTGASVTPGDEFIVGESGLVVPLKNTISLSLKAWTRQETRGNPPLVGMKALSKVPTSLWY